MKIAVWHNLPSGGGKRALYYHVRGLVERGHEITCWSLDTADQSYLPLTEFAREHVVSWPSRNGSSKHSGARPEVCSRCSDGVTQLTVSPVQTIQGSQSDYFHRPPPLTFEA